MFYVTFLCSRKDRSSHQSPVKKRVKESTPPQAGPSTEELLPYHELSEASKMWLHSTSTANKQRNNPRQQPIVIADDSPSPVDNVITISSESEEEDTKT